MNKSWFKAMMQWTNMSLSRKRLKEISFPQFMAYVGLEIAMSFVSLNTINDYWKSEMFLHQTDFSKVMSRDIFKKIRANVYQHDPEFFNHEVASHDPLHHSWNLLSHFPHNCAKVAVPVGCSALDENSARTKAKTRAISYMPDKPDKFAIHFYAVVSSHGTYLHSMMDNQTGNTTPECAAVAYCRNFPQLRSAYNKVLKLADSFVNGESASAIWVLQMVHQTLQFPTPSSKRYFFSNKFYTRHTLAQALKKITDGEARLMGSVRFTNVDATNRFHLKNAIEALKNSPRGSWSLVRAYDKGPNYDQLQRSHAAAQRPLQKEQRTPFVPPMELIAEKCGYIVFKDSKVVVFYTNDLASTPSRPILHSSDEEAISAVNGLGYIKRWHGNEILSRTQMLVPAVIVAYNHFMNSVDRMDQLRSSAPTRQKEKHLSMTLFTLVSDLAMNNARSILQKVDSTNPLCTGTIVTFKRKLCEQLVTPFL
jgi:hypothetical protein